MLYSLYEKAITKRDFVFDIDSNTEVKSQIDANWFNRNIVKSNEEFSIAAGDGSFNKRKFLTGNFCAVDAEAVIYDGTLNKLDDCDIFQIPHVSFLNELLSNYMAIFELKCALRAIKQYDVDYYLFDGSILGDLQNAFPKGAKIPDNIRNNFNNILPYFEDKIKINLEGLIFPEIIDEFKLDDGQEDIIVEQTKLQLAATEKIILLKELLNYRKKIISISKSSSDKKLFGWDTIPDIAILDKFTKQQGISLIKQQKVHDEAAFPCYNDFFKTLKFSVFYVRLEDNKNVLKVELPYNASRDDIFRIIEKLKVSSVQGYPYLLNMAHNDVIIKDKNMNELLKIAKIYETTNREML